MTMRRGERVEEPSRGETGRPAAARLRDGEKLIFGHAAIAAYLDIEIALLKRVRCDVPICQLPGAMALRDELDSWLADGGAELLQRIQEKPPRRPTRHEQARIERARRAYEKRAAARHRLALRRQMNG